METQITPVEKPFETPPDSSKENPVFRYQEKFRSIPEFRGIIDTIKETLVAEIKKFYAQSERLGDFIYLVSFFLDETYPNALYHGNYDLHSSNKKQDTSQASEIYANDRARYDNLFVEVSAEISSKHLRVEIRDHGKGIASTEIPDVSSNDNLLKSAGRGRFIVNSLAEHCNCKFVTENISNSNPQDHGTRVFIETLES